MNINYNSWIKFDNKLEYNNSIDMIEGYEYMNIILLYNDIYIIWEIEYL